MAEEVYYIEGTINGFETRQQVTAIEAKRYIGWIREKEKITITRL